jgi:signal transduction histidine kinase
MGDEERLSTAALTPGRLAWLLVTFRVELLERWTQRVLEDPAVPDANRLPKPTLEDHVPALVERLVKRLARHPVEPWGERVGREVGGSGIGVAHAHQRIALDYSLPEALRELSLFRVTVLVLCEEHHVTLHGEEAELFHATIDEMMTASASELERISRRMYEQLLRTAEAERERLKLMFQEAPAAICLLRGQDFTIELANLRILDAWGKTDAILGQPLMEALPELQGQGFDDLLRGVLKRGVTYQSKDQLARLDRNRDGLLEDVYFDFVYVPLRATDGTIESVFVHAYEVTEKVIARRRAEGLREDAVREVRTREELLAIVSHDLRNPLSTVLMGAKQIERWADDSESGVRTKKAAGTIVKAVDRMNRLVNDLLDLAQLEAGQPLPIEVERHDVVELARQAADQLEPLASSRKLTLRTNLTTPTYVLCDGDRVQQALSNLIGNAIKFTREGGAISVEARRTDGEVLLSVSDTGAGIPGDLVPNLFKPYWRADAQRKDGAGLGLSIVKAIVETHGGRIWVDTVPGKGSTFYFTLPAADAMPATKDER